MTEVEKARIVVKIDELGREKSAKERELDGIRRDFASAWAIYGSKLAGPDFGILPDKIEELAYKIECLKNYLETGKDPKAEKEMAEVNIRRLGQEISVRSKDQDEALKEFDRAGYVLSVCNGEQ